MKLDKKTINFYKNLYWDYHVSEEDIIKIIAKEKESTNYANS